MIEHLAYDARECLFTTPAQDMTDKSVQVSSFMSTGWTEVRVLIIQASRARSGFVEPESVTLYVPGFSITWTITVFDVLEHSLDTN